jgi:hypothetical protein
MITPFLNVATWVFQVGAGRQVTPAGGSSTMDGILIFSEFFLKSQ